MRELLVIAALALPWLNPLTLGPNTAAVQAFFTALTASCLLVYAAPRPWFYGRHFVAWVAAAWCVAAGCSALIGLLQYLGASAPWAPWVSVTGAGEAYANLRQRNQFASLLNLGLAAVLWWQAAGAAAYANTLRLAQRPRLHAALLLSFSALLAIACAASGSRTGLLQTVLLALGSVFWVASGPTPQNGAAPVAARWLALWLLVCLGVALWLLPHLLPQGQVPAAVWERTRAEGGSCNSRLVLWSNVLQLIAEKPWTGWGIDGLAYAHFSHLYDGPRFCEILDNAHNLPLHIAVILGVPAALLVCGGVLAVVLWCKPWREADAARQLAWRVLLVIGLHSMLEYPLWYSPFQLAVVLAVILLLPSAWRARALASSAVPLVAGASFVLTLYAGWDYLRVSQVYLPQSLRLPAYQEDALEKAQSSWLFQGTAQFAVLSLTAQTPDNAKDMLDLSLRMLHFSPEPMVLDRVLQSAQALGRRDLVDYYQVRYRAAYPAAYAQSPFATAP